jgi:hypothetical protein
MAQPIVPIRSSTQAFTEIVDIDRDLVLFADGSVSLVISTAAVNFGLLSDKEQDAIIFSYAGFLNSLSFPIQILIQTKHKDISAYLKLLEDQEARQKNPKLAQSIHGYRTFVASMVKEKDVLDKKFYIVIPFSPYEMGVSASALFSPKKKGLPYDASYIFDRAEMALSPKRDHVVRILARVGLHASQVTTEGLVKLFFAMYNPGATAPDLTMIDIGKDRNG